MAGVIEYIDNKLVKPGSYERQWTEIRDAYNRKLWHQLTILVEKLVKDPEFRHEHNLFELYDIVVSSVKDRVNQYSLAEIACATSEELSAKDPKKAIEFLENVVNDHMKSCKEGNILCNTYIGMIHLNLLNDMTSARNIIETTNQEIETLDGVTPVHSRFYRLSSLYYRKAGKHAEYYNEALKFLGCVELSELDTEEKQNWAFSVGIAALIGDNVYNFGELLTHDIVDALRKSPEKGWLIDLLEAFSHGELEKISALKAKWSKEPDLSSCVDKIEEKATVLCLIELIFVRPANNRTISFKEIAEATNCAVRDVEHLLMRALSLKLIRGRIDEVNQTVNITWLQPRVLDNHQIGSMNKRLKTWCSSVSDMKDFIEVDAKAIIA